MSADTNHARRKLAPARPNTTMHSSCVTGRSQEWCWTAGQQVISTHLRLPEA